MSADSGCLLILGSIMGGMAVGCVYGAPYGWMAIAVGFIFTGLLRFISDLWMASADEED